MPCRKQQRGVYRYVCTGKEIKIIEVERASLWNFEPLKQMQTNAKGGMGRG
jgi:hypothetical protein